MTWVEVVVIVVLVAIHAEATVVSAIVHGRTSMGETRTSSMLLMK